MITKKYSELDAWIPTLTAGEYDLTIDCGGVNEDQFYGNGQQSPLGQKINNAASGVLFNITLINTTPDRTKYMFFGNTHIKSFQGSSLKYVYDAENMFYACSELVNVDNNDYFFRNIKNGTGMFAGCSKLVDVYLNMFRKLENGNTMFAYCNASFIQDWITLPNLKNAEGMFIGSKKLNNIDLFMLPKLEKAKQMFSDSNITTLNVNMFPGIETFTNLTNATQMFENCKSLTTVNMQGFDSLRDASKMFMGCSNLTTVSNATDLKTLWWGMSMFEECRMLKTLDCSAFSNIENTNGMFYNCKSLTTIITSQSSFIKVKDNSRYMFYGCSALTSVDLSGFLQSIKTDNMLDGCSSLTEVTFNGYAPIIMGQNMFSGAPINKANIKGSKANDIKQLVEMMASTTKWPTSSVTWNTQSTQTYQFIRLG